MNFSGVVFTDSGGFQALSLEEGRKGGGKIYPRNKVPKLVHRDTPKKTVKMRYITEEGIHFRSIYDGSWHMLSPERSIEEQVALGADMILVLDDCQQLSASW